MGIMPVRVRVPPTAPLYMVIEGLNPVGFGPFFVRKSFVRFIGLVKKIGARGMGMVLY